MARITGREIDAHVAAKIMKVHTVTVRRWCREGKLRHRRDAAQHYYIDKMHVDEIIERIASGMDPLDAFTG